MPQRLKTGFVLQGHIYKVPETAWLIVNVKEMKKTSEVVFRGAMLQKWLMKHIVRLWSEWAAVLVWICMCDTRRLFSVSVG